jgi:hypothetical protein
MANRNHLFDPAANIAPHGKAQGIKDDIERVIQVPHDRTQSYYVDDHFNKTDYSSQLALAPGEINNSHRAQADIDHPADKNNQTAKKYGQVHWRTPLRLNCTGDILATAFKTVNKKQRLFMFIISLYTIKD